MTTTQSDFLKPFITFIIVTKNDKIALKKTLDSINASDKRINILIKDCNSVDGTSELCEKYVQENIFYISKIDNGIYDGMNQALEYVKTKYLLFLNAGEMLYTWSIDTIIMQLFHQPIIVKFLVETEFAIIRKERAGYFYFMRRMLNHQGLVYNINCFYINYFNHEMKITGDLRHIVEYNLWKKIEYCDKLIVKYQGEGIATNFNSIGINWKERMSVLKWKKVDSLLKLLIFASSIVGYLNWKIKSLYKI